MLLAAASSDRRGGGALPEGGLRGVRTCAGCGRRTPEGRDVLVRIVFGPEGELAIDSGEGTFGRGTYVHPQIDCVRTAGSKGVARRRPRDEAPEALSIAGQPLAAESLRAAVVAAYRRRLMGLFSAGRRARSLAIGSDAARAALAANQAALVVVAVDAAAAASTGEVQAAVASGRAVAWGTKRDLGNLLGGGRDEGVGVVAILEPRLASAVRDAVHVVDGLGG